MSDVDFNCGIDYITDAIDEKDTHPLSVYTVNNHIITRQYLARTPMHALIMELRTFVSEVAPQVGDSVTVTISYTEDDLETQRTEVYVCTVVKCIGNAQDKPYAIALYNIRLIDTHSEQIK